MGELSPPNFRLGGLHPPPPPASPPPLPMDLNEISSFRQLYFSFISGNTQTNIASGTFQVNCFEFCYSFTATWFGYCNTYITAWDRFGADQHKVLWTERGSQNDSTLPIASEGAV